MDFLIKQIIILLNVGPLILNDAPGKYSWHPFFVKPKHMNSTSLWL